MDIRRYFTSVSSTSSNCVEPTASDSVGDLASPSDELEESVSLRTHAGSQHGDSSTSRPTVSSSSTGGSSGAFTDPTDHSIELSHVVAADLLKPRDEGHKREILQKGPKQPTSCVFPKRKFSNGNLSFNPSWYHLKESRGWLEYSVQTDKMYCLSCRLFESELTDKNEPNWIRIGVSNWKKGVEKIKITIKVNSTRTLKSHVRAFCLLAT